METNELKKCKNCSTDRVWYEGYCQNCYGEIYKQRQVEIQEEQKKNYIENPTIKNYSYEPPKQELGMNWFNFYTNVIMIIFIMINLLNAINTFFYDFTQFENSIVIFNATINFGFCYYRYIVYKDLKNKIPNSIDNLLIFLTINLFIQMFNVFITKPEETSAYFMGYFFGLLTIYIPNLIYFYKRKDIFKYKDNAKK